MSSSIHTSPSLPKPKLTTAAPPTSTLLPCSCTCCPHAQDAELRICGYVDATTQTDSTRELASSSCADSSANESVSGIQTPAEDEGEEESFVQVEAAAEIRSDPNAPQDVVRRGELVGVAVVQTSTPTPLITGVQGSFPPAEPRAVPAPTYWRRIGNYRSHEIEEDEVDAYETEPEENQVVVSQYVSEKQVAQPQWLATPATWSESWAPFAMTDSGDVMDVSPTGTAVLIDVPETAIDCIYSDEMEGVTTESLVYTSFICSEPPAPSPFSEASGCLYDKPTAIADMEEAVSQLSLASQAKGEAGYGEKGKSEGSAASSPAPEPRVWRAASEPEEGHEDAGECEDARPKRQRHKFPRLEPEPFDEPMDISVTRNRLQCLDNLDVLLATSYSSENETESAENPPHNPTHSPGYNRPEPCSSEQARAQEDESAVAVTSPEPPSLTVAMLAERFLSSIDITPSNGNQGGETQVNRGLAQVLRDNRSPRKNQGLKRLGRAATATKAYPVSGRGGRSGMAHARGGLPAIVRSVQCKQDGDLDADDSDGSDDGDLGDDEGGMQQEEGNRRQIGAEEYDPARVGYIEDSEEEYEPGSGDLDY